MDSRVDSCPDLEHVTCEHLPRPPMWPHEMIENEGISRWGNVMIGRLVGIGHEEFSLLDSPYQSLTRQLRAWVRE